MHNSIYVQLDMLMTFGAAYSAGMFTRHMLSYVCYGFWGENNYGNSCNCFTCTQEHMNLGMSIIFRSVSLQSDMWSISLQPCRWTYSCYNLTSIYFISASAGATRLISPFYNPSLKLTFDFDQGNMLNTHGRMDSIAFNECSNQKPAFSSSKGIYTADWSKS